MVFWFASCGLVSFLDVLCFCFSFLSRERPNKTGHNKNPKNQKCRKRGQTKNSVSAIVFTNSVPNFLGVGYKNEIFCWKHYKNRGLSIFWERKKGRTLTKLLSWKSVQKSVQLCCATWLDRFSAQQDVRFFLIFLSFFHQNRVLPAERRIFLKKKKKGKSGQIFSSKKGNFWTDF